MSAATLPSELPDSQLLDDVISFDSVSLDEEIDPSPELVSQIDQNILYNRNAAIPLNSPEVSPIPMPIIQGSSGLSAVKFSHVEFQPEYPSSHDLGHATVINLRHVQCLDRKKVLKMMGDVQYSAASFGSIKTVFSTYLNCQVEKRMFHCGGVKVCEFCDPELMGLHHYEADIPLFEKIERKRRQLYAQELSSQPQRQSLGLYTAACRKFQEKKACIHPQDSCALVWRVYQEPNIAGVYAPYLSCSNWTATARDHFVLNLMSRAGSYDLQFLEDLVKQVPHSHTEYCATMDQCISRRQKCMATHLQGIGSIQKMGCNVFFTSLIPINIKAHPYAIFYSRGKHTHPPPPPNKSPQLIIDEVISLIKEMQGPDLTPSIFLKSPALKQFLQKNRWKSISEIHTSFVNSDRFSAIIAKQKALAFPEGRDFNGVMFEYENKPGFQDYTRHIYTDDSFGTIIICGFDTQIKMFGELNSFEVDMSYKRVKGKFNEVIFATFLQAHGKIFTLLRVFMDRESPIAYKMLFTFVFKLIGDVLETPIKFHYLHNCGIQAIVVDMDYKQMKGLGLYLQEQGYHEHDWQWHCRNILIFCRVHFIRTVSKLVPVQEGGMFQSARTRMISLLYCSTEDEYYQLIQLIIDNEPHFQDWAIHKRHPVIASGLCRACSLIKPEFFDNVRTSTNAVEQTHYKSYWMGTYTSLLGAIQGSYLIDERDCEQHEVRNTFGINNAYRSNSIESRYYNHLTREITRNNRKRSRDTAQLDNTNDEILLESSSSGHINSPRASSRGRGRISRSQSRASSASPSLRSITSENGGLQRAASINYHAQSNNAVYQDNISVSEQERRYKAETERIELENLQFRLRLQQGIYN